MRRFNINNPWTKDDLKNRKKKEIVISFVITFIVAAIIITVTAIHPADNNDHSVKMMFIGLEVIIVFLWIWLSLKDIKERFSNSEDYDDLIKMAEKDPQIKNYIDKIKKERELVQLEFLILSKIYKYNILKNDEMRKKEMKDELKQKLYG